MADQSAKEGLIRFLDEKAFLPVLDAKLEDYPESKRHKLKHVKRATQNERQRFRSYDSAQDVVTNFKRDLHSGAAAEVHRELRDLNLPTINDVRGEFEKLAGALGVEH